MKMAAGARWFCGDNHVAAKEPNMPYISSRRRFMKHAGLAMAGAQLTPWLTWVSAADSGNRVCDDCYPLSTGYLSGREFACKHRLRAGQVLYRHSSA